MFFICYETGRSFEISFLKVKRWTIIEDRAIVMLNTVQSNQNFGYLPTRATFSQQLRLQASPKRQSTHSKILSLSSPYTGTSLQWLVILFCHNCQPTHSNTLILLSLIAQMASKFCHMSTGSPTSRYDHCKNYTKGLHGNYNMPKQFAYLSLLLLRF